MTYTLDPAMPDPVERSPRSPGPIPPDKRRRTPALQSTSRISRCGKHVSAASILLLPYFELSQSLASLQYNAKGSHPPPSWSCAFFVTIRGVFFLNQFSCAL
ncbi:hypothetical protein EI94DRAFT_1740818, partial [Lactarius quietus]